TRENENIEAGASISIIHANIPPQAETYFPPGMEQWTKDQEFVAFISYHLEHYLPLLTNIWLLGALFYFFRMMGGLYDLQKLRKGHRESVSNHLLKKVSSLNASLGIFKQVRVLKSFHIHVPITYGIFKPVVLLPAALVLSMD